MGVNLLRRARKDYHGMLQKVQCIVYGWTTNGCNVTVMCGRKEHRFSKSTDEREVDYQRWVGSVLSAS